MKGELNMICLKRIKYQIEFQDNVLEFKSIICNERNLKFVEYYIIALVAGIQKIVEIFIDKILWIERMLSIWPIKNIISTRIKKKVWSDRSKFG
jgi:hypothetical protein